MAENSAISWTDHTFNPWIGCTKVGPGCDHCYAETWDARGLQKGPSRWGAGAPRTRTSLANWQQPRRWNSAAAKSGARPWVFCASLADVFDNEAEPEWRWALWQLIAETQNLRWILVTKRIGNAAKMLPNDWTSGTFSHVGLVSTIVNQAEADRDITKLLATPAAWRGLSMEPLLGPVDLSTYLRDPNHHCPDCGGHLDVNDECPGWHEFGVPLPPHPGLDWVIVGGESGPGARPMHPDWARSLRDQCTAAGVPFHLKQWGEWGTASVHMGSGEPVFRQFSDFGHWVNKASGWVKGGICLDAAGRQLVIGADFMRAKEDGTFPVTIMDRVGKKAAGRLLDGVEHNGMPEVRP